MNLSEDTNATPAAGPAESSSVSSTDFSSFGLDPYILRALTEQGYTTPTPIQQQAIPVVLTGRDVMGAAQTGTGKTAGFALPIIQMFLPLASASTSPARHPVRALILVPTRELADQVYDNVARYAQYTPLRSAVVFGGIDMTPQTAALRAGVEILIATPGRLLDHVQQKNLNLGQVQILVLDEADRMLDMGFLPDLQRIINLLPKQRQNLMFSATFSNEIKKLAQTFMNDPQLIETARRNQTADNVSQVVYRIPSEHKRAAVAHIVREHGMKQILVFSNTKIGTSRLARELIKEGINADAIHGDKTQKERMIALDAFKKGDIDVLVATDVAARGLDIVELPCVINYDLPHAPEDYIHRIGRTARAGASGDAISLMSPDEERYLADIEKLTKNKIERRELENFHPGPRLHRPERTERPDGRPRSERPAPSSPQASVARVPRYVTLKSKAVDEWFLKPYEASPESAELEAGSTRDSGSRPHDKTAQRKPIAALLGGAKKSH